MGAGNTFWNVALDKEMPELSVIVPVLNERPNVPILINRLSSVLVGIDWEVIFVDDDSDDGTSEAVRAIAQSNSRVRIIHRINRRGLASACVEGFLSTSSPYVAVMDGDLQHDERILPEMLNRARGEKLDLVVASRHLTGGSMGEFSRDRVRLSNLGKLVSRCVLPAQASLTDPMSGFFLLNRSFLNEVVRSLSQIGFKILVDIVASSPRPIRFVEVPYTFSARQYGASKLDTAVRLDFLLLVADKLVGDLVPVRFIVYCLVGLSGVAVHLAVLLVLYAFSGVPLLQAQGAATVVAIAWNFFLNNALTYSDRKLRGRRSLLKGVAVYYAGCAIGAVVNLAMTRTLVDYGLPWYFAAIVGMIVSSVWNFGIAEAFTWKLLRRRRARIKVSQQADAVLGLPRSS